MLRIAIRILMLIALECSTHPEAANSHWLTMPADLHALAQNAPPDIAQLWTALSTPADKFTVAMDQLRVVPVSLFPLPIKKLESNDSAITVRLLGDVKDTKVDVSKITGFVPYEQSAHAAVSAFLDTRPSGARLNAAETALLAVLRFHHATRLPDRDGDRWHAVRVRLDDLLRDVRVRSLAPAELKLDGLDDWRTALAIADRLRKLYPRDRKLAEHLRALWIGRGALAIESGDFATARAMLDRIDHEFVNCAEAKSLRDDLRQRADTLMKEAESSPATGVAKLREAYALWPQLPGLGDALAQRLFGNRVLYVGVAVLPDVMIPAYAVTDAERAAAELLFENLLQPTYAERIGFGYRPQLASTLPHVAPGTLGLELRRDAYWSTGERVTSADVRHTAQFFNPSGWRDFVSAPQIEQPSFHLHFPLRQGLFDPLGQLTFSIVPQTYRGKPLLPHDAEFAAQPVGSGPYVFAGRQQENGRTVAVFRANPHYVRADEVLPAIREVRFVVWPDEGKLKAQAPDVIIDVPADKFAEIRKADRHVVHTMLPRRVAFLAVNHRVKFLADANVRRALAHVIDREEILAQVYRRAYQDVPGLGISGAALALSHRAAEKEFAGWHRPLNGPYPPNSWACCPPPRVPAVLHNDELARAELREAARLLEGVALTLKYPLDDPRTAAACEAIAAQVNGLLEAEKIKCRVQCAGLASADFVRAIRERDFELAYMQHEYHDEAYWLWPLFDPSSEATARGGSNYLGYDNDARLVSLLRAAAAHRQFSALRDLTHTVHARLHETMPFIPLWQLHRNLAVGRDLDVRRIDPLHVFTQPERWRFQTKP